MSDNKKDLTTSDYERIGKDLELIISTGYANKRRMLSANFLRGVFFGLGTTIGVSIILALLLYMLTLFSELPFVGNLFDKVEQTINQTRGN